MKVLGIIVEYNPMHNGHIYQIEQAKKLVKPDYTIVIMSGPFTEQGNISLFNKSQKAELAIKYGTSLVLELPVIYATSSAEYFSKGAINILNSLGTITHLAFGAECGDLSKLLRIAQILLENEDVLIAKSKSYENKKINSAKTQAEVLSCVLSEEELGILKRPNNILAIQYLKNLLALKSNIEPILIKRTGTDHESLSIDGRFASSTAIRNMLKEKNAEGIKGTVPQNVFEKLLCVDQTYEERYWQLLKYEITKLNTSGLSKIHEISEGLENRIYTLALAANSYDEFLSLLQTKRYTLGRLKRICNNILLGITKDKANSLYGAYYARVLKASNNGIKLLTYFNKYSSIPVITSAKSANTTLYGVNSSLELDFLANKIHNLIFNTDFQEFTDITTD